MTLATVLRLTGLDKPLEQKANETIDQAKGIVAHLLVITALVLTAAIFALLALMTGFVELYVWLEPLYGMSRALDIAGGCFVVTALVFIGAAMIVTNGNLRSGKVTATPKSLDIPPHLPLSESPVTDRAVPPSGTAPGSAASDLIAPLLLLVKAQVPRIGSAPIDDLMRGMEPRIEKAAEDTVTHAATLVQSGDHGAMLAVLGAAMVFGWLLVKAKDLSIPPASGAPQPIAPSEKD